MKITFIRLDQLSGMMAGIYTVRIDDEEHTLLDRFIVENKEAYQDEVKELYLRLKAMGHKTGTRDTFFKKEEGRPGDGVEALYDNEERNLRLYCIRNGSVAVILGGGGPKSTRTWQEDPKLSTENRLLQHISATMIKALRDGDLRWSHDGTTLLGELSIESDDYR